MHNLHNAYYAQQQLLMADLCRKQIAVQVCGVVQGVGFRPFVYSLARRLGLAGQVANTGRGVEILLSGPEIDVDRFLHRLKTAPPPLARITGIAVSAHHGPGPGPGFSILASKDNGRFCCAMEPNSKWVAMEIDNRLDDICDDELMAHIIWEMTFYGWHDEDRSNLMKDLDEAKDEIDKLEKERASVIPDEVRQYVTDGSVEEYLITKDII